VASRWGPTSWSNASDAATAWLAERARTGMTDALDEYLAQPFYVAGHVTGRTGEFVAPDELHDRIIEHLTATKP
jgi:F0F1-type ATP synthase beta subunit